MAKKILTRQQTFDKVVTHLLTQNKQSKKNGKCLYRGPNGLTCAVGCLIPDKKYDQEIEGLSINKEIAKTCGTSGSKIIISLLSDLQYIHDKFSPKHWKRELNMTARAYDLNTKALDNFKKDKNAKTKRR